MPKGSQNRPEVSFCQANIKNIKCLMYVCESPIPLDIILKLAKVFENDIIHFEDNLVFNKIY